MRSHALILALLAATLGAPLAAAQETPQAADEQARPTSTVTFYPHIGSLAADFPMPGNTQFPHGESDLSAGQPYWGCYPEAGAPAYGVLPAIPGTPISPDTRVGTCKDWDNNILYVYSTAGFVHVNWRSWDGSYEVFHNERGQAKDIVLDTTQDITSTFFMSADFHGWAFCNSPVELPPGVPWPAPCWNWDPGVYPRWRVEATLFIGSMGEYQGQASEAPPIHAKVVSGDVVQVAQGISEPIDMVSLDSTLNGHGEVYEFPVNLGKPQVDKIPKEMDWIMRFRWWIDQGSFTLMPGGGTVNYNVNSGEFYPARFTLPVRNAFDVELVYPSFVHDKLLIHAMLNSPWGSYDVDSASVALEITNAVTNEPVDPQRIHRIADFSVAHGGHYKPVNVTWVWDHVADRLKPGTYKVSVTAHNFQHSASGTTVATFRVNPDGTGTTLTVGRSGQATFTEDQLRSAEQGALGQPGQGDGPGLPLRSASSGARQVPGLEPLALLAALALTPIVTRRRM